MTKHYQFIFSGRLVHPNIFRLRLFGVFSERWFTPKNFLTELTSPISGVHFSFATIFQYLNFAHNPNLSFPMGVVYNSENRLSIFYLSLRNKQANIGNIKKNRSNFEQRERKYANTWGGRSRARCQKSLQKNFYCIPFLFTTIFFHSAFTFMRF